MKKAALITAYGCEESETLTIADILRRAELTCDMVSLEGLQFEGAHHITMKADRVLSDDIADYDMIILPGGYGGTDEMLASVKLRDILVSMNEKGKMIAAICAAPQVLDKAGLLEGKNFTCYPGVKDLVKSGTWLDQAVVDDGNITTGIGPAFVYEFAYHLADLLGADSETVKKRMVFSNAFYEKKEKKAAILMEEGFEESETITIVDILRRGGVKADTLSFEDDFVLSMQGMYIKADKKFDAEMIKEYDIIVVPGGRTAWQKLCDREDVLSALRWFDNENRLIAAMCSGTKVVNAAGVIKGKKVTGYTGYENILTDSEFCYDVAVYDQNVITSQGPATPYPFAFKILEAFNIDPKPVAARLLYEKAGGKGL